MGGGPGKASGTRWALGRPCKEVGRGSRTGARVTRRKGERTVVKGPASPGRLAAPRGQGWCLGPVSPQPQAVHQISADQLDDNTAWLILPGRSSVPQPTGPASVSSTPVPKMDV